MFLPMLGNVIPENLTNRNNSHNFSHTNSINHHEQQYSNEPNYYESYYHPIKSKLKNILAFFITLAIIIFVGFLIWKIPYTRQLLVNIYMENPVIQSIINFFYE